MLNEYNFEKEIQQDPTKTKAEEPCSKPLPIVTATGCVSGGLRAQGGWAFNGSWVGSSVSWNEGNAVSRGNGEESRQAPQRTALLLLLL